MAIDASLVARFTVGGTTATSTGATTAASGSTFVVLMSFDATTTQSTPTDNKGNTYVQAGTTLNDGTGVKEAIYYAANAIGGAGHTLTATFSGTAFAVVHFVEVTGAASASFDTFASAIDTATPFTVTSPTLAQAAELVLTLAALGQGTAGATNTYASSNTTIISQEIDASQWWTSAVSKLVTSSTAAVTPSFTVAFGTGGGLMLATFKEATAGAVVSQGALKRPGPGRDRSRQQQFTPATRSRVNPTVVVVTVPSTGAIPKPGPGGRGPFTNGQFVARPAAYTPTVQVVASSAVSAAASQGVAGAQAIASAVAASQGASQAVTPPVAVASSGAASQGASQAAAAGQAVVSAPAVSQGASQALASAQAIAAAAAVSQAASQGTATPNAVASSAAVSQAASQAVAATTNVVVISSSAVSAGASQALATPQPIVVSGAVSAGMSQAIAGAKGIASSDAVSAAAAQAIARVSGVAVWPLPSQVLAGVTYGPTGVEYTGTLSAGARGIMIDIRTGKKVLVLNSKVVRSL